MAKIAKPTSGAAAQGVQSKAMANGAAAGVNREADWEQFQAFVAQVEQAEVQEDGEGKDRDGGSEDAAREAEESLENMQYVDRYRQALELASVPPTSEGEGAAQSERKRDREADDDEKEEEEEEDLTAVVREAAAEAAKRRRVVPASHSEDDSADGSDSDSDSDDLEDLTNWRSKGI